MISDLYRRLKNSIIPYFWLSLDRLGVKKIGPDLYLDCPFTFKFPAVASKCFLRYRGEIFLLCTVTSGRPKLPKYSRNCREFNTFFPASSQSSSAISDATSPVKFVRENSPIMASRYRAPFQASSGHSDNADRPGYEAAFFLNIM